MKPYKTFLFFLSVLFVIAVLSWCLGGTRLVFFDHFTLTFPSWGKGEATSVATSPLPAEKQDFPSQDQVESWLDTVSVDSLAGVTSSSSTLPSAYQGVGLEIPSGEEHALYVFFRKLSSLGKQSSDLPLRVLHYGDSQIEGDRITSSIREGFQRDFGGKGPGLLPLFSSVTMGSYGVEWGRTWEKLTVLDPLPRPNFGASMGVLRCVEDRGELHFKRAPKLAYERALHYDKVRLLTDASARRRQGWKLSYFEDSLPYLGQNTAGRFALETFSNKKDWTRGEISCERPSAKLYGIALDGDGGVAVDNIPLRGSPGYIFQKSEPSALQESFSLLQVGMVIYQFGVNAVPNSSESMSNARAFEEAMTAQLLHLRRSLPQVPVVVIGVSDRALKEGAHYRTNPNVYLVRQAQRRAAQRAGCIFWDLFEAMGGEASIVGWLHQNPALAGKDLTHFTAAGARRVGELFYEAFYNAYTDFCQKEKAQRR